MAPVAPSGFALRGSSCWSRAGSRSSAYLSAVDRAEGIAKTSNTTLKIEFNVFCGNVTCATFTVIEISTVGALLVPHSTA